MNLIFDLDGTLICSKQRLYEVFCDLSERRNLTLSEYWNLKFIGKSNQDILKENFGCTDYFIEKFVNHWMRLIESDHYLEMDTLIDGADLFLEAASKSYSLYICTARQSVSQVKKQLSNLSILHFFDDLFVTEQKYTKAELLKKSGIKFSENDWMIGDTGHDVMTGKEIGINTCAVLSGFMTADRLLKYEPDLILKKITELRILQMN